jgi:hypothetical protein
VEEICIDYESENKGLFYCGLETITSALPELVGIKQTTQLLLIPSSITMVNPYENRCIAIGLIEHQYIKSKHG